MTLLISLFATPGREAEGQIGTFSGRKVSEAELDRFVHHIMDSLGLPGLSSAVLNGTEVVCHRALGAADVNARQPVDTASIFETASLSKTPFAFFVMKMAEAGKLELDTPLYRYLPCPDIERDPRYRLMTARLALSYNAGFPNGGAFNESLTVYFGEDPL